MKKTILLIGILIARISCFSEQQAIVTNANTNSVHGAEMAGSKGAGDDKIVPASGAMLRDYEQNPERWQNEQLFSIALGYVCETNIERAIASYNKFLSSQPNNVRAIRGLGNYYMMAQENDAAISQYKKGWALGDDLSLFGLANTYGILSKRYDDLKPLIP